MSCACFMFVIVVGVCVQQALLCTSFANTHKFLTISLHSCQFSYTHQSNIPFSVGREFCGRPIRVSNADGGLGGGGGGIGGGGGGAQSAAQANAYNNPPNLGQHQMHPGGM